MRPKVEDEVRRNLFFFEAVLFDAVPAVLDEIEHALGVRLVQPVLSYGCWTGGDMDGHPEVGADTLAQRAAAAPQSPRCGCCATAWTSSRACSLTPRCGSRSREELEESLKHDAEELPSADVLRRPHREWEPLRTKLGFVATGSATRGRPRGREPGYARRAGAAARPRARARPPRVAARGAGLDPAAAVAGRRVRLPPGRDRHPPGRGRRARGGGGAAARATPPPTRRAAWRC